MKKILLVIYFLAAFGGVPRAWGQSSPNKVTGSLWAGPGYWWGDITYQIGGRLVTPDGVTSLNFPLSELKWPTNVAILTGGGNLFLFRNLELRGQLSGNIQMNAGKMQDSDWTDMLNPGLKTIFSESDTSLTAFIGDLGFRYWLASGDRNFAGNFSGFGLGAGVLYQNLNWDVSNVDQSYPQDPTQPHDRVAGFAGSYKFSITMPYAEAAGRLVHDRFSFLLSLGYAPEAKFYDEDNHAIRQILAKANALGSAIKTTLQARYDFLSGWFLALQGDSLSFNITGTETNLVYGGPDAGTTWAIDHKIFSQQWFATFAVGLRF